MTRIIAGRLGGRTIAVPPRGTRPTSDRVRESLFSVLESDGVLPGARVLDLFAGSGALGLEAASRGAQRVDLVERDRKAAQVCRENVSRLGLGGVVRVHERSVETFLSRASSGLEGGDSRATLVFVDPPYDLGEEELARVLRLLVAHLAPGALVVVERSSHSAEPTLPPELAPWRTRRHGETVLHLLDTAP